MENKTKVIKAEMYLPQVFLGLGGNIGDSCTILSQAIEKIALLEKVFELKVSRFYCTTPVSSIPQGSYTNAVCSFKTAYSARELLMELQNIEKALGKKEKLKQAPRMIDLDILFYGVEVFQEVDLQIPHPRWSERLFVVAPLADLEEYLFIPDPKNSECLILFNVKKYLKNFPNIHHETVTPLVVQPYNPPFSKPLCTQYNSKNSALA